MAPALTLQIRWLLQTEQVPESDRLVARPVEVRLAERLSSALVEGG
jgi:hypothetical protein